MVTDPAEASVWDLTSNVIPKHMQFSDQLTLLLHSTVRMMLRSASK